MNLYINKSINSWRIVQKKRRDKVGKCLISSCFEKNKQCPLSKLVRKSLNYYKKAWKTDDLIGECLKIGSIKPRETKVSK